MKRKVTCFTSMALAVLMAVSPIAGNSFSVFAAEPSDDTTAIQVTPTEEELSDEIVVEADSDAIEVKKEMQASVKVGDTGESDIVVETEYQAGDSIPVHVTAENPTDKAADFRLYFWDYAETLPEDKAEWSKVLTDACENVKVAELQDTDEYAIDLKQGEDTVQGKVSFASDKDDKDQLTAAYLSIEIPADTALDTVFHISSDVAETVTVVPVFDAESENAFFGDAAAAQWKENPIVVEAGETEDIAETEPETEDTDAIVVETEEPADSFLSIYVGDGSVATSEAETGEPAVEEEAETEEMDTEESNAETETEAETESEVSAEAEGEGDAAVTVTPDTADLNASDFASMRLVVLADDVEVITNDSDVIGQYGNVYLLQFTSIQQAMNAYVYYKDKVTAVEPDVMVEAADETETVQKAEIAMTEDENPVAMLNEVEASEKVQDAHGVIALIDTGVSESNNVIDRVSVIDDALEGNGHGDDMAEAIVSQDADAKILSIRAMDDEGFGTVSSLVAAMEYAMEQKVDIINLSLYAKATLSTSVLEQEILKAVDAGILVVGSAGNDGQDVAGYMPGSVEEAYIIGAADANGSRLEISNFGETVDYNVVAESTSNAAALFTGYVSANGLDAVEDAVNQGLIYDEVLMSVDASVKGDGLAYENPAIEKYVNDLRDKAYELLKKNDEIGLSSNSISGISPMYVGETITSACLKYSGNMERPGINVVDRVQGDDYKMLSEWDEGILGSTSGEQLYCANATITFHSGVKLTARNATDYYSQGTIDTIAALFYYIDQNKCSCLTNDDIIMIKQACMWTVLNKAAGWWTPTYGVRIDIDYGSGQYSSQGHAIAGHYYTYLYSGQTWYQNNKDSIHGSMEIFENGTACQPLARVKYTYNPIEYTNISVKKSWSDFNNESGVRPGSVQVGLYRSTSSNVSTSGSPYKTVTLNASNGWSYTWKDLEHKNGNTTYYYAVKEISLPTYYTVSYSQPESVKGAASATVTNKIQEAYLKLHKDSALPNISDNNNCYSLAGAEYTVYTTRSGNALSGAVGVLKTDENGDSNALRLLPKTYYVKETKAPKGFEPNPQIYTVKLTTGNTTTKPYVLNVEDVPGNDPTGIEITKIWNGPETDTIPTLEGTQFTIKYYDGYYTKDNLPSTPKRTWVLEVKKDKNTGKFITGLADSYLVEGSDEFYRDGSGLVCLPYGTISIQETKPAAGYTLEGYLTDKDGNTISTDSEIYVAQINESNGGAFLQGGNEFTGYNTPVPGKITLKKFDSDGNTPLAGVTFQCVGKTVEDVYTATTDSNGEIVFDNLYPDVYTITETSTVDGHTLLKEPIVVEVPMRVTEEYINEFNVDRDSVTYDPADDIYYIHEFTYEITNDVTFKMPMSGGFATPMTFVPLIAGMGILGGLGVVGFRKKRKK